MVLVGTSIRIAQTTCNRAYHNLVALMWQHDNSTRICDRSSTHPSSAATAKQRAYWGHVPASVLDKLQAGLSIATVGATTICEHFASFTSNPGEKSGLMSILASMPTKQLTSFDLTEHFRPSARNLFAGVSMNGRAFSGAHRLTKLSATIVQQESTQFPERNVTISRRGGKVVSTATIQRQPCARGKQ